MCGSSVCFDGRFNVFNASVSSASYLWYSMFLGVEYALMVNILHLSASMVLINGINVWFQCMLQSMYVFSVCF